MAYTLPFGKDVNHMIARYTVGYPSDRIKDMMSGVRRHVYFSLGSEPDLIDIFIGWSEQFGPTRNMEICLVRLMLFVDYPIDDATEIYPSLIN